ncbi:MAG: AMP-binding protein [Lacipirellulaceae bacterium]
MPESLPTPRCNVADRLAVAARERPRDVAVAAAKGTGYRRVTFAELDSDATRLARGLVAMGVRPGTRLALLVRPGPEFVTLVFALLRSGATMVLVDSGLGRKHIIDCLSSTEPEGFVAIPIGHALRLAYRSRFPKAKLNVTVGRRWLWGGETLDALRILGDAVSRSPKGGGARGGGVPGTRIPPAETTLPHTTANAPAAIVFTSGSTGPPKGVLYTHGTFATQCAMIQQQYDLRPGAIDLACFPLFGLFNVACGITTVLPEMDFARPASCDPAKVLRAANDWKVTQAFASPAVWDRLSRHCEENGASVPTLRKVLSCGAPVPAKVIRRTLACVHPEAELHTPYGMTEALPIATIEAREILGETAAKTDGGAGVCVGRRFGGNAECGTRNAESNNVEPRPQGSGASFDFDWRVIRIRDDTIATIDETEAMPLCEIGELIVRGPQVSQRYLTREPEASAPGANRHNALAKIADAGTTWHRTGDVGYFDDAERFWYCGRKSQRVVTDTGTLYTECFEGVVNSNPVVEKSALVAIGEGQDRRPCVVVQRSAVRGPSDSEVAATLAALIPAAKTVLFHPKLPTDVRHNSKIRREELAVWAEKRLGVVRQPQGDSPD